MYNASFVTSDNKTFKFGYEEGTIFDIDPLSEIDVDVSTSQGFQQTGVTVEAETVSGVSREIKGVFTDSTDTALALSMINIFTPGTHGKLYFNDEYYCDCVVQKTPLLALKNRKRTFDLMLFCSYPYWIYTTETSWEIGGYTACFELPVCYDEHIFGIKNSDAITDCYNEGSVERPIDITFTSRVSAENYGVENTDTGEYLQFDDTLESGEKTHVYWDEGRLKVEKTIDGETENAMSILNEGSTLFTIYPGNNNLKQYADTNDDQLTIIVTLSPATTGVIADV